jgi:RNA polymerase sigma-70 factor (ECF subfamily)
MGIPPDRRREVFEAVALPCAAAVHRFVRRLTRDPETAADLVQDVFLRAYRSFDAFEPGSNCRAWLLAIAYSVFINRHRKDRRAPPLVELSEVDAEQVPAAGWSVQRDFWTGARLESALLDLPEEIRAVVVLVLIEELTYVEAAQVLNCPVGTIRSRLFRGRRALFVSLQEQAADAGLLDGTRKA